MSAAIIDKLKTLVSEELDVNLKKEQIDEHASIFDGGLGLDSIVVMELIALIERHYKFQFDDEELNIESFSSMAALADMISLKVA